MVGRYCEYSSPARTRSGNQLSAQGGVPALLLERGAMIKESINKTFGNVQVEGILHSLTEMKLQREEQKDTSAKTENNTTCRICRPTPENLQATNSPVNIC